MHREQIAHRLTALSLTGRRQAGMGGYRVPLSAIAAMLGVSRQTVNEARRGRRTVSEVVLIRLRHLLDRIDNGTLRFERHGRDWVPVNGEPKTPPQKMSVVLVPGGIGLQFHPKPAPPEVMPSPREVFRRLGMIRG